MKTTTQPTPEIFANCKVVKLREYRLSYGAPEIIEAPFIKEFDKEIHLINANGGVIRVMRKFTKLLKSFEGSKITERTYKLRTAKNLKAFEIAKKIRLENEAKEAIERQEAKIKLNAEIEADFNSVLPYAYSFVDEIEANKNLSGETKNQDAIRILKSILSRAQIDKLTHFWAVWKLILSTVHYPTQTQF